MSGSAGLSTVSSWPWFSVIVLGSGFHLLVLAILYSALVWVLSLDSWYSLDLSFWWSGSLFVFALKCFDYPGALGLVVFVVIFLCLGSGSGLVLHFCCCDPPFIHVGSVWIWFRIDEDHTLPLTLLPLHPTPSCLWTVLVYFWTDKFGKNIHVDSEEQFLFN